MAPKTKIIIDTDISLGTPRAEIDDGAALLLLLNSPEVEVLGITTVHGNVPVDLATTNALRFLSLAGFPEVPVFQGAGKPLVPDPDWMVFIQNWQGRYGSTPTWENVPQPQSAVEAIISFVEKYPGQVSIIALGPLTNLAQAFKNKPSIAGIVKSVVAMGGSISASPQAEFNIRCDPEAADLVFNADWPLFLHGLEITREPHFTPQDFNSLKGSNPALSLLKEQAAQWIPVVESQGWEVGGCSLHDAVAAAGLLQSDLFTYQSGFSIKVELDFGPHRGVTKAIKQAEPGKLSVATGIDPVACKQFILSGV